MTALSSLNPKIKLAIIIGNDFSAALICWMVFGPPMATFIASEFSTGILVILFSEWLSFVVPTFATLLYLYLLGFYKTVIKFFDSQDSIFLSLSGSLIFGFTWAVMHIYQFNIVSTSFLSIALLQGFLLAAVFLCIFKPYKRYGKVYLVPSKY